ncbi:MAG TPA: NAD(P)/FAD-dependent oxidoreductase [Chthoniobacterales bacterium]|nr:NAD(P)/FAD-dependent oxidoreductase [Chthoniobacterales bacterium]
MEAHIVQPKSPPRVVIVGGGFGGLTAAKELAGKGVRVALIDRTNHHLFQPLLYEVATAGLSPADIAQPIRHILRDAKNIEVVMGEVDWIDADEKQIQTTDNISYAYDYLILAAGARHSYFGHDEWESFAPGLKSLEDAIELRRRILKAFEAAEMADSKEDRQAALTFTVVGAGPTGVEMAGAIAELAHKTLAEDFRRIDARSARVLLLDGAPRILPSFPEDLSRSALAQLKSMGVEVHTGAIVKGVNNRGVTVNGELLPSRTVVWAAGNAAAPISKSFGAETDRVGRVLVNEDLSVPGHPGIFAIGDMACFKHQTGQPLPGVSPVAMQMGRHASKNILLLIRGEGPEPFRYFDKGSMATIGRNKAIADLKFARFGGFLAWLSWLFVHLIFLVGLRNRLLVLFQWTWSYLTFGRGARLIYGTFRPQKEPVSETSEANY